MAKSNRRRQKEQIRNSVTYEDDLPSGPGMELTDSNLEADLNNIRSQLSRIIGSDWFADPQISLSDLISVQTRKFDQSLVGVQDNSNQQFISPEAFIHDGTSNETLYWNGIRQKEGLGCDYQVFEAVINQGYTIIVLNFTPKVDDILTIDYTPFTT